MIILNGAKFAESEQEFINSLFSRKTCSGYAKRYKHKIKLFDHNHNLIGVITEYGVLAYATLRADGKYWYSYATIPIIGEYESYMQSQEEIDMLAINKLPKPNGEYYYTYK